MTDSRLTPDCSLRYLNGEHHLNGIRRRASDAKQPPSGPLSWHENCNQAAYMRVSRKTTASREREHPRNRGRTVEPRGSGRIVFFEKEQPQPVVCRRTRVLTISIRTYEPALTEARLRSWSA